jgi:ribosomal protein L4
MKAVAIEIPKTNIKTKQTNNIDSKDNIKDEKNINFLDLLLKDIKNKQVNNIEESKNNIKDEKDDITKDIQELLKNLLLDKKDTNILKDIPNLNIILR